MSQAVLDQFYRDIRAANKWIFDEEKSSLKGLLAELKRQLAKHSCIAMRDVNEAKDYCADPNDKRLNKYATALANLVNAWGKTSNPLSVARTLVPPAIPPSRPPVPPRIVAKKYDGDPMALIDSKADELKVLGGYTSLDASNFDGSAEAIKKEKAFPAKSAESYKQACVAAAGKKKLQQSTLKAVYDKTIDAKAGVCTTFALAVAHVLTGGARQSGKVRVEVLGCDRGRSTHMYVVAGRSEASRLDNPKSWGPSAVIVDAWGTATYGNELVYSVKDIVSWGGDVAAMYFTKIGQFYDNATPDPTAEDNKTHVEVQSIERTLALQKSQNARRLAAENQQSELAKVLKKRAQGT